MTSPMLKVKGLVKAYGSLRAVDDVSFAADAGSVVALLGPNGAGKTTTFKCILGVTGFAGSIDVAGLSVAEHGKEARRRIGYLPQTAALSDGDTCRQALEFLADLKGAGKPRIGPLLELVHLSEQAAMKVGRLSGGMRQRLALAAALLADPPVLLLDEPTASLDLESHREFHELIARLRDEGKTIVLSTHFLDRLGDLADRAIVLNRGRLVFEGTMAELAERAPSKRFVVNLNGTAPAAFAQALRTVGIGPELVSRADSDWEDLLRATGPGAAHEQGERR